MKISVLGYGRVGKAIVDDLVKQGHDVTVVDFSLEVRSLTTKADRPFHIRIYDALSIECLRKWTLDHDLIVNALPGDVGYSVTKNAIEIGKNIVDISFAPQDYGPLRKLAEKKGVIVAVDCGLAPGMWNMMLADSELKMNTKSCVCYVGGLPKKPEYPFGYKAPYHPRDVVEMYTRESRFLVDGKVITKPALTDMELIQINNITVEAFNTDGLRTMLEGMVTPTIIEKTLRYPGTAELMRIFRDIGFFNTGKIHIEENIYVQPIKVFEKLAFPFWQFDKDEVDITLMQVVVDGERDGEDVRKTFKLYDEACDGFSSMARTTGYTATAVVDLINQKIIDEAGFYAPEDIGTIAWDNVLHYLEDRGIIIDIRETLAGW